MRRQGLILFLVALLILPVFALTTTSCARKEVKKQVGLTDEEKAKLEAERLAREKAAAEAEARRQATLREQELAKQREAAARDAFLNEHALFDFDKYNVRPDAEAVLRAKAGYMNARSNVLVEIQGHCDERGTEAYNMALGDRRAKSAKNFLETLGIAGPRMSTVSFGESRPLCSDRNEGCWQQNRRAQFVIIGQ